MTRLDARRPGARLEAEDWQVGQIVLGGYTVDALLGRGSFGQVYRVSVGMPVPRRYAVKRLAAQERAQRYRCLRELQAWVDLPEHPHLVTLRFPHLDDQALYLFADCIDGGTLAARPPIDDPTELIDVGLQLAWGLHACHLQGLVHADVKPANVFVTPEGIVKLGDFGISRSREAARRGGMALGTARFRSPEQQRGEALDHRSDLWSWGATLEAAARPSALAPLRELLDRCKAPDPRNRPASALEAASWLQQRRQQAEPRRLAWPEPAPQAEQAFERRGRHGQAWPARDDPLVRAAEGMGRRAKLVGELAAFDTARTELLARLAATGADATLREHLEREQAEVEMSLTLICEQLNDLPGRLQHANSAVDLLTRLPLHAHGQRMSLARAWTERALVRMTQHEHEAAVADLDRAESMLDRCPTDGGEDEGDVVWQRSRVALDRSAALLDLGRIDEAVRDAQSAVALRTQVDRSRTGYASGFGVALGNLANALNAAGRRDQALAAFQRAVEALQAACWRPRDVLLTHALICNNRGVALIDAGRLGEAIDSFDAAIGLYRPLAPGGVDAMDGLAWALSNRTVALQDAHRWEEACRCGQEAVQLHELLITVRPELAIELANALANLASAESGAGRQEPALVAGQRGLAVLQGVMDGHPAPSLRMLLLQGLLLIGIGEACRLSLELERAALHFTQAIDMLQRRLALRPGAVAEKALASAYEQHAMALQSLDQPERALQQERLALICWQSLAGRDDALYRPGLAACEERIASLQAQAVQTLVVRPRS